MDGHSSVGYAAAGRKDAGAVHEDPVNVEYWRTARGGGQCEGAQGEYIFGELEVVEQGEVARYGRSSPVRHALSEEEGTAGPKEA